MEITKHIWISGTINSGKSSVVKLLGQKLQLPVIELDTLSTYFEHCMEFQDYIDINYEILINILEILRSRNIKSIVVYPISEKRYAELGRLQNEFDFFSIDPTLDIALTNRGERKLDDWERNRIKELYEIGIHNPSFGTRIETKNLTALETVDIIISQL